MTQVSSLSALLVVLGDALVIQMQMYEKKKHVKASLGAGNPACYLFIVFISFFQPRISSNQASSSFSLTVGVFATGFPGRFNEGFAVLGLDGFLEDEANVDIESADGCTGELSSAKSSSRSGYPGRSALRHLMAAVGFTFFIILYFG
ncbi:uncharacterized protein BYT42DRAFT_360635 [Radiomyces spectabilis]|uniref:uncharacterized protein n=1 Tax=Radiomyces spectabilis TaxID=64574 RepID=UPI00221FB27A|nr:uncharacterized protein BYT42DRAFT_360635 [Radiomyces spectabilis]KAI8377888.1 hypothetical protein BYT42DRAFT_360635 [Radiomyces spectabilis]